MNEEGDFRSSDTARIFSAPALEDVLATLKERRNTVPGTMAVPENKNEFLTEASMELMPTRKI